MEEDAVEDPREREKLARLESLIRERKPDFQWIPWEPLPWAGQLQSSRPTLSLVTTAGVHLRRDPPFTVLEDPNGDTSYRIIHQSAPEEELELGALYVDQKYVARDPEVALPRRALATLEKQGLLGAPTTRHYSFCGGITDPLPGLEESARSLTKLLRADRADGVVFLPTCSLCVQTVCLLARAVEDGGIPTVCITLIPELSHKVGAPRSLAVRFPFGAPAGDPGNSKLHQSVLLEALDLLRQAATPGELAISRLRWRRTPAAPPPA